jgi:glycosyltransferase involved in cell wall biosynthesis
MYYSPGVEATAYLLTELCTELAREYDVTVVTGMLSESAAPGREVRDGVRIIRVRSTSFERRRLALRAVNYFTYVLQSFRASLTVPPPDLVLAMTDPPVIADVAWLVARRFRAPLLVISQDVFPEIAIELGRLKSPTAVAVLRAAIRFYLKRADRVVAIGDTMRSLLEQKGAPREVLQVIPNWVDTAVLSPQPRDNDWAREHGFVGKFVLMHSGNVGYAQNLDVLIQASTLLRDLKDLAVVIVGSGARHAELVALAQRLEADAVEFLPYQPREVLPLSLSAADMHFVGLARGLAGYVVPSRLYGVLAVGRPVLVAADELSETAQVVKTVHCGVAVPADDAARLAAAVRSAYDGEFDLDEMGRRGREYVVAEADRAVAFGRYRRALDELLHEAPARPAARLS